MTLGDGMQRRISNSGKKGGSPCSHVGCGWSIPFQDRRDAHEETKEQRGSTASKLAELASEKDASR
eukprot:scaffold144299_cov16-Tisochrysis_lutea.AAC.2